MPRNHFPQGRAYHRAGDGNSATGISDRGQGCAKSTSYVSHTRGGMGAAPQKKLIGGAGGRTIRRDMAPEKPFTTGGVAPLLHVTPVVVPEWIQAEKLTAARVPGGPVPDSPGRPSPVPRREPPPASARRPAQARASWSWTTTRPCGMLSGPPSRRAAVTCFWHVMARRPRWRSGRPLRSRLPRHLPARDLRILRPQDDQAPGSRRDCRSGDRLPGTSPYLRRTRAGPGVAALAAV